MTPEEALTSVFQRIMADQRTEAGIRAAMETATALLWMARAGLARRYARPGNMHGWFAELWTRRAAMHLRAAAAYAAVAVRRNDAIE